MPILGLMKGLTKPKVKCRYLKMVCISTLILMFLNGISPFYCYILLSSSSLSRCRCSDLLRPYRKCLPLQYEGNPWLLHIEIMRGGFGVALLHTTALIASAVCTSTTASGHLYAHVQRQCVLVHVCVCVLVEPLFQVLCVCVSVFVLFIRTPIFSALLLGHTLPSLCSANCC